MITGSKSLHGFLMSMLSSHGPIRVLYLTVVVAVVAGFSGGCGESGGKWDDPREVYGKIAKAAAGKDGGFIYDMLDSSRRAQIDTFIGMQMGNIDSLSAEERPMWEALKGLGKREIYSKILESDPAVSDLFGGDSKVVKLDTFMIVTVEHNSGQHDLLYLRWERGRYVISAAPDAGLRPNPMPAGHPQVAPGGAGVPPATQGKPEGR